MHIKRVAVLGSGVMGAAIAGHLANCGIPSIMLDIVTPNLSEADKGKKNKRNQFVDNAKAALLKAKPAPLYKKSNIDLIQTGNFEDDMEKIADCDWIIEVVKEDLNIKKKVFDNVAKHRRKGSIVSSNTSGIPIKAMAESMDEEMSAHFLGTHFFNPPRYLKLLEIIPSPNTKPEVIQTMADFCENVLGKGIVYAKDTPNFVANRILTFAMQWILHNMQAEGMTVEEVDAVTGTAIGHASSATFRTADLVGLDTLKLVVGNVYNGCPNDERRDLMQGPEWFSKMIEKGYFGLKSGSGFYKKTSEKDEKGKPVILSIDPETLEYTPQVKPRFDSTGAVRGVDDIAEKLRIMHQSQDKGAQFVFKMFANVAQYAGNRIPEIADDIVQIDNACKWGFAWDIGIFETWDVLGFEETARRMEEIGVALPPVAQALRESGNKSFYKVENGKRMYFDLATKSYKPVPSNRNELVLANVKSDKSKILKSNDSADIIDIGDGVICVAFHSKMNALDADNIQLIIEACDLLEEGKYEAMVLGNQEPHFCAGANLFMLLGEIMQGNWDRVELAVTGLQTACMRMKYCSRPIVAAPHHYTFGGGVEICQHTAKVVIAGETYAGLVEVGVGLLPAGGGTKEMLVRALEYCPESVEVDPFPFIRRAFEDIATAKVGTSGAEVIELGYFRPSDILLPNYDHQIAKAKAVALGLVTAGYKKPLPPRIWALGEPARAAFRTAVWSMQQSGYASEHDGIIAEKIANVLTGGNRRPGTPLTEQDVLDLEKEAFVSLCGMEKSQARMQSMLATGKPLRN